MKVDQRPRQAGKTTDLVNEVIDWLARHPGEEVVLFVPTEDDVQRLNRLLGPARMRRIFVVTPRPRHKTRGTHARRAFVDDFDRMDDGIYEPAFAYFDDVTGTSSCREVSQYS